MRVIVDYIYIYYVWKKDGRGKKKKKRLTRLGVESQQLRKFSFLTFKSRGLIHTNQVNMVKED